MNKRWVRAILAAAVVLTVLLIPACDVSDGRIKLTGPPISPEISAAISLAAELM